MRIFRKSIDWVGKIHEHPDVEAGRIGNSNATITFGKSPSHDIDPARNLRILGKAYAEGDRTPRTLYYLARELVSIGNYE